MKLYELIERLNVLAAVHGSDTEVYTVDGCGCCEDLNPPRPRFTTYWGDVLPGIYLNS